MGQGQLHQLLTLYQKGRGRTHPNLTTPESDKSLQFWVLGVIKNIKENTQAVRDQTRGRKNLGASELLVRASQKRIPRGAAGRVDPSEQIMFREFDEGSPRLVLDDQKFNRVCRIPLG